MSFITQHKFVVLLAGIAIAGVAWWGLSGSSAPANLTTDNVQESQIAGDRGIVQTLLTLRAVKLDGAIFSDPAFLSLKDFSTDIVNEPVGRPDPFAPLQSSAQATTTTTKSTSLFGPKKKTK